MYNNSYMNFCASGCYCQPMQSFMPVQTFVPMQSFVPMNMYMPGNPYVNNPYMAYYRPVNIFAYPQRYIRPQNYYINNAQIVQRNYYPQQRYYTQSYYHAPQKVQQQASHPKNDNKTLIFGAPYNKSKGELLAKNIVKILPKSRKIPLCAKYVKLAVEQSGLGAYVNGNGEACKNIFRANPNFKEVNVKGKDFDKLPPGSIIVYDSCTQVTDKSGNKTQIGEDGHVLITTGNGKGCSDKIEDEIWQTDKAYVFIPV